MFAQFKNYGSDEPTFDTNKQNNLTHILEFLSIYEQWFEETVNLGEIRCWRIQRWVEWIKVLKSATSIEKPIKQLLANAKKDLFWSNLIYVQEGELKRKMYWLRKRLGAIMWIEYLVARQSVSCHYQRNSKPMVGWLHIILFIK